MTSKLKNFIFILALLSSSIFSEELQEVIVLEKKLSSLNGWSSNQSISSINKEELNKLDAQHPKQIFRRSPGVWISRGSGQEHLTAIRSPVLSGPGACGSFLVLEDGLPIRPTGFCNVNGLFETFSINCLKGDSLGLLTSCILERTFPDGGFIASIIFVKNPTSPPS